MNRRRSCNYSNCLSYATERPTAFWVRMKTSKNSSAPVSILMKTKGPRQKKRWIEYRAWKLPHIWKGVCRLWLKETCGKLVIVHQGNAHACMHQVMNFSILYREITWVAHHTSSKLLMKSCSLFRHMPLYPGTCLCKWSLLGRLMSLQRRLRRVWLRRPR